MSNVTPGYTFTGPTDPITYSKLNLLAQPTVVIGSGEVTSTNISPSGIGYSTGAGGSITQQTNKSTVVILNTACGDITLNNAALNAGVTVSFTITNSLIAAGDNMILNHSATGTFGSYVLNFHGATAGSGVIDVTNRTTGNLSEAIVIRFSLFKGVTA